MTRPWTSRLIGIALALAWMRPVAAAPTETLVHQDPIHKAGRGVTNILTCWIEIPKGFSQGRQEDNPFTGIGMGLVKGFELAFIRLGLGAYETVTFPIPYPKHYASPYATLELPDYAWE